MTLSRRLLILIALALAPPLLFGILNDYTQRSERAEVLHQMALVESQSVQDSLALVTGGARRLLLAVAEAPSIRSGNTAACHSYLNAIASQLREYTLLAVTNRAGLIICNDGTNTMSSISVADRAYFHRSMETGQFASGDLVTGLITGRSSMHFSLPYRSNDGELAGVVTASIDQTWLARQLASEAVPRGADVIMLDASGVVVAAAQDGEPVHADWVGRALPAALGQALAVPAPQVVETEGPDGKLRLFGVVPSKPALAGLRVFVGVDRHLAFADLRAASVRNMVGLGLGGLIALLVGVLTARRFVLNPLSRIAMAADRVGAGDLNARADLGRRSGEIRDLGAGFDRMIAALASREQERDQAETALRREEARLRLAIEAGGLGSFEWDLTTNAMQASDSMLAMYGISASSRLTLTDFLACIVPEDIESVRADIRAGIAVGRVVHSYRIMRGGERRFLLVQGETVQDAAGQPFLIGLVADETERFENLSALRESEARFQAIADCIDQMVWSTRSDGRPDYYNQRWFDFTGTTPDPDRDTTWDGLVHPDDHATVEQSWRASLASGTAFHLEYRLRHVSGRFRWVLARAQAIHDDAGDVVRWYGTCTDIDELVQAREVLARSREVLALEVAERTAELMAAEEQLRQSQKMEAVGQLTGGIAHDFNNMLQAIGGALELLVRRVDQNKLDDAKRFAGVARTTVDRAASLTHRLLAFARRQTLSPEAVDPVALVAGMAELVSRTVGPGIEVTTRPDGQTWMVLCDVSQLENVVFNLCINARDAMSSGGRLTITTANVTLDNAALSQEEGIAPGDYVEIAVADTGTGMDEATQARAFEPFFTTKPMGQGTGLGLSQVYGFVRQSGGFVRLESHPGRGTTVHLFLPRYDRIEPPLAVLEPASTGDNALILLVEDDPASCAKAAKHLRGLGYRVRESASGAETMLLLTRGLARVDLLVTAVGLAGNANGRQIAEAARARWPGLPVLFITDFTGTPSEGELAPGTAILADPFTPDALADQVRHLLAGVPAVA